MPNIKRILFVASEGSYGMAPFAVSIINSLSEYYPNLIIHCIFGNSNRISYKDFNINCDSCKYVETQESKLLKGLYKIWPIKVVQIIKEEIKKFNPDAIHFLTGDFSLALFGFFFLKKDILYYTVHDLHPHESEYVSLCNFAVEKIIELGCFVLRKCCLNLTTSSREQYEELLKLYPSKKIYFLPFPSLVTKKIMNGRKRISELNNIDHYILFFGYCSKYKGVELLISSFIKSRLKETYHLVIAGKGDDYLSQRCPNIIRINRYIQDAEIASLFKNAEFVVYPYLSATMSGVLSLPFYFNKHIVLSDIPFFLEYACELTHYYHNGDGNDLERKIVSLSEYVNETSNQSSAYSFFYSTHNCADCYAGIYE